MWQQVFSNVFTLNASSLLVGDFSLGAGSDLKKASNSYFNASSEVT